MNRKQRRAAQKTKVNALTSDQNRAAILRDIKGRRDILEARIANVAANLVLSYGQKLEHKSQILTPGDKEDDPDRERINTLIDVQERIFSRCTEAFQTLTDLAATLEPPLAPPKEEKEDGSDVSGEDVPDKDVGREETPAPEGD